jgi:hypothetical protein
MSDIPAAHNQIKAQNCFHITKKNTYRKKKNQRYLLHITRASRHEEKIGVVIQPHPGLI